MNSEVGGTSRRAVLAMAAGALPLWLAACSTPEIPKSSPLAGLPAPDSGTYSFSVDHVFGNVTLKTVPTKIITFGLLESESVLALGLPPRGRTSADITPWYNAALNSLKLPGKDLPQLVDTLSGLPVTALDKLEPDLILNFERPLSKSEYDTLSEIAPVVMPPKDLDLSDWRAVLTFVGKLTGRTAIAAQQIATTENLLKSSVGDYPDLPGNTTMYIQASTVAGSDLWIYESDSAPLNLLKEIGFTAAPAQSLTKGLQPAPMARPQQPAVLLPRTRAKEISADVLLVLLSSGDFATYKANGNVPELPDFGSTNILYVSGNTAQSLDRGSILGIQWASRNMVPELARTAYTRKHPLPKPSPSASN